MTNHAIAVTTEQHEHHALVCEHRALVKRIAAHLGNRLPSSVQLDDLVQAGMIGLLEANQHYDPSRKANFTTYAGIRIRGAMLDEIRKGDWTPRSLCREIRKISAAIKEIEGQQGSDAEGWQVADKLGIDLEEYHRLLNDVSAHNVLSLDQFSWADEDVAIDENADPLKYLELRRLKDSLAEVISTLPEKEALVITLYYDEELNLREIGQVLDLSESRVSQIRSQAMIRLKARTKGWDI